MEESSPFLGEMKFWGKLKCMQYLLSYQPLNITALTTENALFITYLAFKSAIFDIFMEFKIYK